LRLLTVTHFFASHGGGIERVADQLCCELVAQGHHCEWAASSADPSPMGCNLTALPLPCWNPTEALTGLPMPVPAPRGLAMLLRAVRDADAVIIHDALYVTSIVAMVAARLAHRPVVLVQHIARLEFASLVMRGIMALATRLVTRPMLRAADRAIFISAAVQNSFAGVRFRNPPLLVFNGVDTVLFHPGHSACPIGRRQVLFVGRFVSKKGLAVIRACAERRPDLDFVLVGQGPLDPAGWGLPNVCLTGPLAPTQVADRMRVADVLLLPSSGEGYPLVVQEALACGLPVICGEDSAASDPGAAGFLRGVAIDPADPEGTAARIVPLLDRPADPATRKEAAAYAAAAYSWRGMAAAVAEAARRGA